MSAPRPLFHRQTLQRLAVGGAAAALIGCGTGEALKPQPLEWTRPAAPQQIYAAGFELTALELAGGGWPARRRS